MRRPTRTRRLSIAAIVSLLAFVVVASAYVRSYWTRDEFHFKHWHFIRLEAGRIGYYHFYGTSVRDTSTEESVYGPPEYGLYWHISIEVTSYSLWESLTFHMADEWKPYSDHPGEEALFQIWIPVWFPLLLLLIAPARWLIARPANAPAFPVVTDAKQLK